MCCLCGTYIVSQVLSLDNVYQFQLKSLGNKSHQAVNGTFRNISPFQTHRSIHSQTRGVFWEEEKKTAKINNTYESWWNTELVQVWRIENKQGNSLIGVKISFCTVDLHTIYRETPECHGHLSYLRLWYRVSTGTTIPGRACCYTLHTAGHGSPCCFHYKG